MKHLDSAKLEQWAGSHSCFSFFSGNWLGFCNQKPLFSLAGQKSFPTIHWSNYSQAQHRSRNCRRVGRRGEHTSLLGVGTIVSGMEFALQWVDTCVRIQHPHFPLKTCIFFHRVALAEGALQELR